MLLKRMTDGEMGIKWNDNTSTVLRDGQNYISLITSMGGSGEDQSVKMKNCTSESQYILSMEDVRKLRMQSMQGDTANYPELNKSHCQPSDNSGLIVSFIYIDSSLWLTFISPFLPNQDSIKLTVKPTALQWSSPREYLPQYDTKYNKLDLMLIGTTKEGPGAPTLNSSSS